MSLKQIFDLVDTQAKDEGLWFVAETVAEAYVQNALRELHALIESFGKTDEKGQTE